MYIASDERYSKGKYNFCGKSGLQLPLISVGLWQNFGKNNDYDEMKSIILTAFDMGVTHFDLANNYGPDPGQAEINFGKIFAENLKPYRDELIISTKAGYEMWDGPYGGRGGTRKYLMASLNQSLSRLGLDYVDIFYHHCMTPETPLAETAMTLGDIVRQGKSLYAGLSNYDGHTMHKMYHKCDDYDVPYIINQNRYSILDREVEKNGLLSQGKKRGMGLIAFSPLAQGRLSDRYKHGLPEESRLSRKDEEYRRRIGLNDRQLGQIMALYNMAQVRGETLSQMAIQWLIAQGVTSVLIGVHTKEQLVENLGALEKPPLTTEELKKIDRIMKQ